MRTEKILILFNPSAGKGRALKKKDRLERLLHEQGIVHDFVVTKSEDELKALSAESGGEYGTIVVAGGDSTFHLAANEIVRAAADVKFGLIGVGSSNDIAREFGLDSLEKAVLALKEGQTRRIDLGAVMDGDRVLRYFIGQANVGLGVFVNRYVEDLSRRRSGLAKIQFMAGLRGTIAAFRSRAIPQRFVVEHDSGRVAEDLTLAVFNNLSTWATGKLITPGADPEDGRLNACLIKKCSFARLALIAAMAKRGAHVKSKSAGLLQSARFAVFSDRPFSIQSDGEIIGGHESPSRFKTIVFQAIPRALNLIC